MYVPTYIHILCIYIYNKIIYYICMCIYIYTYICRHTHIYIYIQCIFIFLITHRLLVYLGIYSFSFDA